MQTICSTAQRMASPRITQFIQGRYEPDPGTGCWNWIGRVDRYGYGCLRLQLTGRRRQLGAHRAAWIAFRGPVPDGLTIDHLCSNVLCVNPDHLEPVTNAENIRRAAMRRRV